MNETTSFEWFDRATSAQDRLRQNVDLSGSFTIFSKEDIDQSIPDRFEFVANRNASRLALKFGCRALSYAELNREANRLAHSIFNVRESNSATVAILLPQGATLVTAILGILKAGKAYLGLDPLYPASRLSLMLEDSETGVLITDTEHVELAEQLASGKIDVFNIDSLDDHIDENNLRLPIHPDSPAYIFYTSGSTGHPKGVFDSHRNVLHNVMRYTNTLCIGLSDRLTLLQSSSFSGSVSSLFGALLNGACTLPFDMRQKSPKQLANWLRNNKVTIYHSVPAIFRNMLTESGLFPDIRIVRLEGDQASNLDVKLFQRHFSSTCTLVNGLGTTETGLVRQYFVDIYSQFTGSILPVGYPVQDMEILILDNDRKPLGAGKIGEIAVRSRYLALGYWKNEQLTETRFIPDRCEPDLRTYLTGDLGRLGVDGNLEHLGRIGGRARVGGHTTEFAEVEMALLELESISEAVVGSCDRGIDGERLVAYYVPTRVPGPTISTLRQELTKVLPDYAIPSFYVPLDSLPRTSNGKIDRASLPQPGNERPTLNVDYVQAQSLVQLQLIQIWEQVLKIHPIGIRDDFFDLGGDSLLVLTMLLQANEDFGVDLHGSALLPNATVEQLAFVIQRQDERLCKPVIELQAGSSGPPLFFLHGDYNSGGFYCLKLADHLDKDIPFYILPPCGVDGGDIPSSYGGMADRHLEVLRQIQPEGPYYLGGTCNGGIVAYEIARRLESQGEEVALLALFFASAANQRFLPLFRFVSAMGRFFGYSEGQTLAAFLRLREIAVSIENHTMSQRISYILEKAALIPRELLRLFRPVGTEWAKVCFQEDMTTIYHTVDHLYLPGSYAGKVTLLWPIGDPESAEQAAAEWRRVADDVELRTLASTHHDCLTKDVNLLAKELTTAYLGAG